jgi:hypothetical protein
MKVVRCARSQARAERSLRRLGRSLGPSCVFTVGQRCADFEVTHATPTGRPYCWFDLQLSSKNPAKNPNYFRCFNAVVCPQSCVNTIPPSRPTT